MKTYSFLVGTKAVTIYGANYKHAIYRAWRKALADPAVKKGDSIKRIYR
jgi:hypothetical protein